MKLAQWLLRGRVAHSVAKDKRIPAKFKWLLLIAVLYGLSPIDLVPDLIPVLGLMDDLLVVSMLLLGALRSLSEKAGSKRITSRPDAHRLGLDPARVVEQRAFRQ